MWHLAIKTKLGDCWHLAPRENYQLAWCDHRIKLDTNSRWSTPDGRKCERCKRIAFGYYNRDKEPPGMVWSELRKALED